VTTGGADTSLTNADGLLARKPLGLSPADSLTWTVHTLIVAILIWNHEPWRDELQAWSIARASNTPLEIFTNTRLEGRPPGWQLLLWPFAQVFSSPRVMQLVALVIGSIAAWLWLRTVALDWRLKAVVLFGFHFTGGYLVHARDYVLSFLVLVAAVAVYSRHGVGWRLAAMLCVLSFVNAFSLAMAAAMAAAAWLAEMFSWSTGRGAADASRIVRSAEIIRATARHRLDVLVSLAITASWFAWAAYLTYPTDDNQFSVGRYKGFGRALTNSFIPLNYESPLLQRIDDFLAAALLVTVLLFAWMRSRVAFGFVAMAFAMLLYNLTYGYGDYWWHFGNSAFIVFVIACFPRRIARGQTLSQETSRGAALSRVSAAVGLAGIVTIASLNLAATRYGAGRDVHASKPYSLTLAAAEQLRDICDDCTIIVDWDAIGAGISAQLGGRELYYLNRREFGTFAKFSNKNSAPTWEDGLAAIEQFERPLLIQTAFMSGPAPSDLELIGVHYDGVHDHNLIWQSANKRILPND
jgi:hypothetical protein